MANELVIRTSSPSWLEALSKTYKDKEAVTLVDDAALGVDPSKQTIFQMGREANLGFKDWKRVAGCAGVGVFGVALIAMAMLDPEPTSKLTLIVASGAFCIVTGAGGAIYILTGLTPPNVEVKGIAFHITWH